MLFRKILLGLMSLMLVVGLASCTSSGGENDDDIQESSEELAEATSDISEDEDYDPLDEGDDDVAAAESLEGGEDEFEDNLDNELSDGEETQVAEVDEPAPIDEDEIDSAVVEDLTSDEDQTVAQNDPAELSEPEDLDEALAETEEPATEVAEAPIEDADDFSNVSEPEEATEVADNSSQETDFSDNSDSFVESGQTWVPVKKAKTEAFTKRGVLANAIYLVRPGDDLSSISRKIYGSDKTSELLKVNSTLASGVKVGDKVYYNSPNRPNDNSRLLTYYEDNGMVPSTYTAQEGENIRTISKKLLGDSGSWKEVWATNPYVESKGALAAGTELKYFAANTTIAQAPPAPAPVQAPEPEPAVVEEPPAPEPVQVADVPPPAPAAEEPPMVDDTPPELDEVASNELPDVAPIEEEPAAAGTVAANDVPPPPPAQEIDDVPAPAAAATVANNDLPPAPPALELNPGKKVASAQQKDQTIMLAALAVMVLALIALFIIIRRRRAKRKIDFNKTVTTTQIE